MFIENRPFIDGRYFEIKKCKKIKKNSPANKKKLPPILICSKNEIKFAVDAAKKSFEKRAWRDKSIEYKKKVFFKAAKLIKKNINKISYLDCFETGRSILNFKRDSIPKAISVIEYFAESLDKVYDIMSPLESHKVGLITRQPLGAVASITSWNDPLVPAMWKACPAILSGNSIVMKPSELSTYSLLYVAKLFSDAGLPKGIMNVVTGDASTGSILAKSTNIDGIFFTGSSKVGMKISKIASEKKIKKISLECGGKSCFVVSENCRNLSRAAKSLAKNIFYNQGQICSAPSRLIISYKIKKEFLNFLYKETEKYIPKNPFDFKSEVGGLISKKHRNYVSKMFRIGKKENCKFKIFNNNIFKKNYSYPPTIFFEIKKNSKLLKEEIFGPILTCEYFNNFDEALNLANNSDFGLASSIWSNDFFEILKFTNNINSGIVHINSYGEDDNSIPFGGIKNSGYGRDKSILAFNEYTYLKSIFYKE